jgi:hypothetical protein
LVFDFTTFSYWFGLAVPTAPLYVDLNRDGGISVFDFSPFASNFGTGIVYPTAFATRPAIANPLPARIGPNQRNTIDGDNGNGNGNDNGNGNGNGNADVEQELIRVPLVRQHDHVRGPDLCTLQRFDSAESNVDDLMTILDQTEFGRFEF